MDLAKSKAARADLIKRAQSVVQKARSEERAALNNDEQVEFDKIMADVETRSREIEAVTKNEEALRKLEQIEALEKAAPRPSEVGGATPQSEQFTRELTRLVDEVRHLDVTRGFRRTLRRSGQSRVRPLSKKRTFLGDHDYVEAFNAWARAPRHEVATHQRALSLGDSQYGGYLVPEAMRAELFQYIDDETFMLGMITLDNVQGAQSIGAATLENDPSDAEWTPELSIGTEDSNMSFGKRELRPGPLTKHIKVSNLLLTTVPSVASLVARRMSYKFAVSLEKAILTGNGASRPLGVFTASTQGISTGRDIATGSNTSLTFAGLVNGKYALKMPYHRRASYIMHRDVMKEAVKLVTNEGEPIFAASVSPQEPDTILGRPVLLSEFAPNTLTQNNYAYILGDFTRYWGVLGMDGDVAFQRLDELYAATNQTAWIGRMLFDAAPVYEEGFVRGKFTT